MHKFIIKDDLYIKYLLNKIIIWLMWTFGQLLKCTMDDYLFYECEMNCYVNHLHYHLAKTVMIMWYH